MMRMMSGLGQPSRIAGFLIGYVAFLAVLGGLSFLSHRSAVACSRTTSPTDPCTDKAFGQSNSSGPTPPSSSNYPIMYFHGVIKYQADGLHFPGPGFG